MHIAVDFDEVISDSMVGLVRYHNERHGTHFAREDFKGFDFWKVWGGTLEEDVRKVVDFLGKYQLSRVAPVPGSLAGIAALKARGHTLSIEMLGKWGTELFEKLRGRDDAPLITKWEAKSVGEQETLMEDSVDPGMLSDRLVALAAGVHARFVQGGFKTFRAVVLTVRFADFTTVSRTKTLPAPDGRQETIQFEALRLLMPFLDLRENPKRKPIRLVGVRVERLE